MLKSPQMKFFIFLSSLFLLVTIGCEKSESPEAATPEPYLNKWTGNYEGTSRHWRETWAAPGESGSSEEFRTVEVNIEKSSLDSSLNFSVTYNDTIFEYYDDLKFSSTGEHFSSNGSGSSYGSLEINFSPDSLHFDKFQKCGIPCSSGIVFDLIKVD